MNTTTLLTIGAIVLVLVALAVIPGLTIKRRLDGINESINAIEGSLVNVIAAFAPWLAPLVPATATYWHLTDTLQFPSWLSLMAAIVVETLGISAVRTTFEFWAHNRKYARIFEDTVRRVQVVKEARRVPLWVPMVTFVFYLLVVVTVNVFPSLGVFSFGQINTVTIALLTLLEIPAGVLIAVRALHRDILNDMKKKQEEPKPVEKVPTHEEVRAVTQAVRSYLAETKQSVFDVQPKDVVRALNCKPSSARTALFRIREEEKENDTLQQQ